MNLSLAGIHCRRCCEIKDQKRGDYHCWKFSEALDYFMSCQYHEYEDDLMDETLMGIVLLFVKRLQNICIDCKREEPLAYRIIKEEYIDPFNKEVDKAITKERAKGNKKKGKRRKVLNMSDYHKGE